MVSAERFSTSPSMLDDAFGAGAFGMVWKPGVSGESTSWVRP